MDSEGQGWKDRALNHEDRIAELENKLETAESMMSFQLKYIQQAEAERDEAMTTMYHERGDKEQAEEDARGWADSFKQAEAALDSFLGPDGGKTVIELRAALAERDDDLEWLREEGLYWCPTCDVTERIENLSSGCPSCGKTMIPADLRARSRGMNP